MNTILAAPALLIIYLRNLNIYEAIFNLFIEEDYVDQQNANITPKQNDN